MYKNGEPVETDEDNFPHGSEVTFNCLESILGEKTTWKIICEDGSWIGISLNCGKFLKYFHKLSHKMVVSEMCLLDLFKIMSIFSYL